MMTNNSPETPEERPDNTPERGMQDQDWASRLSISTNATVSEKTEVTEGLHIIKIIPDSPISFLPGQHTVITLQNPDPDGEDPEVKGYFSVASTPDSPEQLEFLINTRSEGRLSQLMKELSVNDRISFDANIRGKLHLHEGDGFAAVSDDRNLLMIATGTGIAPMMSILRSEETWTEGRSITLLHGVKGIPDSAYLSELLALEATRDFQYIATVTQEDSPQALLEGRVSPVMIETVTGADPEVDTIIACGHFDLVRELKEFFAERGFTATGGPGQERTIITE
jgi:ferredoxin--NADP+ reductase